VVNKVYQKHGATGLRQLRWSAERLPAQYLEGTDRRRTRRTSLDDVVPPLGLTDDVDEVVDGDAGLQDRAAAAAEVVERDGRPRRHVADDDDEYTTQILEQILVADLDSVSLPRLELGKNTAHDTRSAASRYSIAVRTVSSCC